MTRAQIIVLDLGGQYSHLICRRIRKLNVYCEIVNSDVDMCKLNNVKGVILSGGPQSVYDQDSLQVDHNIFEQGIPILGICYGHQLMCRILGGEVVKGKLNEYGQADLNINNSKLFKGMDKIERVWMSHGDTVSKLPIGFDIIGSTATCPIAAVGNEIKKLYGLQFHPEVTHTPHGDIILKNFLNICNCESDWQVKSNVENIIETIRQKISSKNVFMLVSGGVDSTVCFALLEKALGSERLYGLHIDNGFVRKNESRMVKKTLEEHGFKNLHVVDASNEFLTAVKGIYDPEQKRKIIGDKFIEIQKRKLLDLGLDNTWILGQGTIYPDTIETGGSKNSALIKTHHNRVEIIQNMIKEGRVIEPLADLYKDEVRELGSEIGLPDHLIWRHPFPGPGLAVRCLCANKEDVVKVNGIITLPLRSVGVQGDFRTYKHPALISGDQEWDEIEKESTRIINCNPEINRVVILLNDCDLQSFSVKNAYLTKDRLDLLREVDYLVEKVILEYNLEKEIWQFPVVMIPYGILGESIILRPVNSQEAMTAEFARIDKKIVCKLVYEIMKVKGIDAVFYDVTHKPPGTIEWE